MCCFSRSVRFVGETRIFARSVAGNRQGLAYAMNVELDSELAVVLPLPVPAGSSEDVVTFVSLEGYERFFVEMASAFPPLLFQAPLSRSFGGPPAQPKLVVHDVGRFDASFVPTRADFARLDERFRLPEGVWGRLPQYADWGFAVFRLKPVKGLLGAAKKQSVHPMALSFPSREPGALFFPTVHVHDGTVASHAHFDHMLFCQAGGVLEATLGWTPSSVALGARMDAGRTGGLVDGDRGAFATGLLGSLPNDDVWLRPPAGVTVADLRGRGRSHEYAIAGSQAYAFGVADARFQRWQQTAATRLGPLCRGLREGLRELETSRAAAWQLTSLTDELPAHFMNGDQLWTGTSYMNGRRATEGGPGRLTFSPFTERVPVQSVTLAFAELPDTARLAEIRAELARLLDRAAFPEG